MIVTVRRLPRMNQVQLKAEAQPLRHSLCVVVGQPHLDILIAKTQCPSIDSIDTIQYA
jgi:hypothetical protein